MTNKLLKGTVLYNALDSPNLNPNLNLYLNPRPNLTNKIKYMYIYIFIATYRSHSIKEALNSLAKSI